MTDVSGAKLPVVPAAGGPARAKKPGARDDPLQKLRFAIQALTLSGFLAQGFLYYLAGVRPLGNLLPFSAYESIGRGVLSSALLLWAALFALTAIFGRFACGWLCPLGFFQDAGERILRALGRKLPPPASQPRWVRWGTAAIVLSHYALLPYLASPVSGLTLDLRFHEPWLLGFPFRAGLFALDLVLVFAVIGLVLPLAFGPRPYCRLMCETGLLLELSATHAFGRIRRNQGFSRDTCVACGKCVRECPQGIDVAEEVHDFDRVVSGDCIACLRCVNDCPNDTIVFSLRKRVRDTGKAAAYLAAKGARLEDLPRHALTGLGVLAGAYAGLVLLPPSYFHTYLLLGSLGGLLGWLAWRALSAALGERLSEEAIAEAARSQVEAEAAQNLPKLSAKDKMRMAPSEAAPRSRVRAMAGVLVAIAGVGVAVTALAALVPPRAVPLADLPAHERSPLERERAKRLHIGAPPVLGRDGVDLAYGPFGRWLQAKVGGEVRIVLGGTYAEVARALETGEVDAALLPAGAFAALRRRAGEAVSPLAIAVIGGRVTTQACIVALPAGPSSTALLRGKRLALTSLDSVSGFLAPRAALRAAGLAPADLGEAWLAGDHGAALRALMDGRVDATATYDAAIASRLGRDALTDGRLRVVTRTAEVVNDIACVRASLPAERRVAMRQALLMLAGDDGRGAENAREGLLRLGIEGFAEASPDLVRDAERWAASE